jgi:hypothetical protein
MDMERKVRRAARRVSQSPEYLLFSNFISVFRKICRRSSAQKFVERYSTEIKDAFVNLKKVVLVEFGRFSSPAEKINFVRALHIRAPAYSRFYDLNI